MSFELDTARHDDIEQLLALYFIVYGKSYPYKICIDRDAMQQGIDSPDILWLVMREKSSGKVAASALFELDRNSMIGKLTGVVVDPLVRKGGLAYRMIEHGAHELLEKTKTLNSIYATTRTVSVGPQLMCMKAGFKAFGIFPNSHRLNHFETTTLLIRYRDGVLSQRQKIESVLAPLVPIIQIANESIGDFQELNVVDKQEIVRGTDALDFEIIDAPFYVRNLFDQTFSDPYDRFFPFHLPNIVAISTTGDVKIFAHLNKKDGYCVIVALTTPIHTLSGRVDSLLNSLHSLGISYVEILIGMNRLKSIQVLIDKGFLPSAIYPAMRLDGDTMQDFIILSRTMEPLNFRGMAIERQFKPYIDQYIGLWKCAHLESLEVFDDYK